MVWLAIQPRNLIENGECRAYCTLGIIVMSLGIAEICHHTMAQILGNKTAESGYDFGCNAVIRIDDLPPVLGVKLRRNGSGIDKIAKQNREMAAFTGWRCRRKAVGRTWGRSIVAQACAAHVAKPCSLSIVDAAFWTAHVPAHHACSSRRVRLTKFEVLN